MIVLPLPQSKSLSKPESVSLLFCQGISRVFGFRRFLDLIGLELTFLNSVNIYSLWISHAWAVCLHLLWKIINPSLDCIDIVSKLHNLSVRFTSQILDDKLEFIPHEYMNCFNLTEPEGLIDACVWALSLFEAGYPGLIQSNGTENFTRTSKLIDFTHFLVWNFIEFFLKVITGCLAAEWLFPLYRSLSFTSKVLKLSLDCHYKNHNKRKCGKFMYHRYSVSLPSHEMTFWIKDQDAINPWWAP